MNDLLLLKHETIEAYFENSYSATLSLEQNYLILVF
jgi:hypothetical protein